MLKQIERYEQKMNLIVHDLSKEDWEALGLSFEKETRIIDRQGEIKKCIGCFGCWVKTPGQCVIKDDYQRMGEFLAQTEELTLVSKCSFGGFSSFVKNVMDRSISYILPFFEMRNGEMHHKSRYTNKLKIKAVFYGEDITEEEKKTAKELVKANAINLNGEVREVVFAENKDMLKGLV